MSAFYLADFFQSNFKMRYFNHTLFNSFKIKGGNVIN
jgi:hypothetical protein